jgi:hypothetical protein
VEASPVASSTQAILKRKAKSFGSSILCIRGGYSPEKRQSQLTKPSSPVIPPLAVFHRLWIFPDIPYGVENEGENYLDLYQDHNSRQDHQERKNLKFPTRESR